jgi:hypothetical protein
MKNCGLRTADCGLRLGLGLAIIGLMFCASARADAPTAPATKSAPPKAEKADEAKPAEPISVPFELLRSKHIAVKVMINGKGPYRLIFDTGAPFILVNSKTAEASGMLKGVKKPFFSVFNSMGPAKIKNFDVGGVKIEGTQAAVMDHPTVELLSKALGPIEGLVGFPFFARYKMTIDYSAKTMLLAPSGFELNDEEYDPNLLGQKIMEGAKDGPRVLAPAAQWGFVPAKEKDDVADGVVVKEVHADSAASAGGLRAGDRLLTLDGRWTDSVNDAFDAARHVKPGNAVKLVVLRDGKQVTLTVAPRAGL